jgi:hypothetical protein
MAKKIEPEEKNPEEIPVEEKKIFGIEKNKFIKYAIVGTVVLIAGYIIYKKFIKK